MTKYNFEYTTLDERIAQLEERVEDLESERTDLINDLYELENRLQAQIDKYHPHTYNLGENYSLGDK
jgi:chaperonin cofactor prefoldin|tara:strand:+ start:12753 stop:12953 length:201 start_codon:yes stop_codon:yes gene_type:complete